MGWAATLNGVATLPRRRHRAVQEAVAGPTAAAPPGALADTDYMRMKTAAQTAALEAEIYGTPTREAAAAGGASAEERAERWPLQRFGGPAVAGGGRGGGGGGGSPWLAVTSSAPLRPTLSSTSSRAAAVRASAACIPSPPPCLPVFLPGGRVAARTVVVKRSLA